MLRLWFLFLALVAFTLAYEVDISDGDYARQVCSGMWANSNTFINVTFDTSVSKGQVAMVIYEWADAQYLGKVTSPDDEFLPKTYVCTTNALTNGFCTSDQLGRFILDIPPEIPQDQTSFWTARVNLSPNSGESLQGESVSTSGFWNNPEGNPNITLSEFDSPWRKRDNLNPSPNTTLSYSEPIQYLVRKTGYYCVAVVPVTVQSPGSTGNVHPTYQGTVFFRNTFNGQLPAGDYPKVNFYFAMFLTYTILAGIWAWLCYKHYDDIQPIQYYLSALIGLVVVEMAANWVYYRYLNAHGRNTAAVVFLFVVAILDSARNAMSFLMLLLVALGLSVVKESLGRTMLRAQILAGAHFVFGVLYAVGIVELELESTSALILLLFVIPLAFTLSGFLLWIMYALSATINQLKQRKQRYKLSMFEWVNKILLFVIIVMFVFFVVSTMSFSGRLAEDYAANTWKSRWWLLDGWLSLLYLVAFTAIAFLWRPSENNRRLAMSDELAQDEEDAEDYDPESLELRARRGDDDEDDADTLVGDRRGGMGPLPSDQVMFEIGEDDDDDPTSPKRKRGESTDARRGEEGQGLMNNRDD